MTLVHYTKVIRAAERFQDEKKFAGHEMLIHVCKQISAADVSGFDFRDGEVIIPHEWRAKFDLVLDHPLVVDENFDSKVEDWGALYGRPMASSLPPRRSVLR